MELNISFLILRIERRFFFGGPNMKFLLLLLPVAVISLSGCEVQRAMDRNRYAIYRSTEAIERNVEALDKVTANLEKMQEEQ
jgi:hypothetical protein